MSSDQTTSDLAGAASLPRAVLWDMDGTLLDSEKHWDVAVRDLSRWLGGEMSEQTRLATVGASSAGALRVIFDSLGLAHEPEALAAAKEWMYSRVETLFADGLEWRPGAREALTMVREAGLSTALVTNTERRLTETALDVMGRHFFDASVCGDEVPAGKPAPDPYLRGAQLLGLDPRDCVAVEDSPTGTAAATAAGCAVLVVPGGVIDVPTGPGRLFRDSLVGLTSADLAAVQGCIRT
ncbi:MAG: HAD family phosphatase [Rhodococcus sp.]|nr:HAD family phosphatase [Rhodococcus sp. (in: high G+C Gram-positive bacteria)]